MTTHGMSLRNALKEAQRLGVSVEQKRGTGELMFRFPGMRPVAVNQRRKDASRALTHLLHQAGGRHG